VNTTFRKLDLFPSSGEGDTASLLRPLERANLNHRTTHVESSFRLRPTVSRPVCLAIKHPSEAYGQIFINVRQLWGALSDESRGLSLKLASNPRQRSHSRVGLGTTFYRLRFETALFVTSYASQGYRGSIRPLLQMGSTYVRFTTAI
jgi:hypothetical protein